MFRNKYSPEFWDTLLSKPYIFDSDIHIENAVDGDIFHLDEKLGKYRVGSGITNKNRKYNPNFPLAQIRGYERGMDLFSNDPKKLEIVKYHYALSMLQQAYNYAIYDKDRELFKYYVDKSIQLKFIGVKQVVFKLATVFPLVFFKFFDDTINGHIFFFFIINKISPNFLVEIIICSRRL